MQDFESSNGGKYYFPLMYQLKKNIFLRKGGGNSPSQTSTAKQSFF